MNRKLSIACLQYSSAKNEKHTLETIKDFLVNFNTLPKSEIQFLEKEYFGKTSNDLLTMTKSAKNHPQFWQ